MNRSPVRLGDYVNIKTGKLDVNAGSDDGQYPFFTCARDPYKIDFYDYDCECVLVAGNGDLNVKYYQGKFNAYQRTYIIEPKDYNQVYVKYLYFFLDGYIDKLRTGSIGGVIKYIKLGHLTDIQIPLPPQPIQKQITALLEKADTLRSQCKQMEQELNQLAQSVYVDTVGNKAIGYTGWPEQSIEDLCLSEKGSMRTGPFGSDLKHSEFVESGIAVIGIDNAVQNEFQWEERRFITEEKYKKLKRYRVYPNDVIVTIMGTVGRTAVIPEDIPEAISTKHLAVLTLDKTKALSEYISDSLKYSSDVSQQIRKENKGAIMEGLNLGIIKKLKLNVPPIQVQSDYLIKQQSISRKVEQNRAVSEMLEDLFNSSMQRAFSGKLNLTKAA
ncbi:MAG: restriction endonuclease subunit S [Candidatus Thiodiazotropha sp. (ex Clathrolucina costata)]|nr:restriction endonuclease subunit S [Candidatus Thiodiazotropha taylori]